ncbi:helix-turn-helix domain-containing protein [Vibrio sp. SCSIO 43140]|nr:helix-turn-helix domain-containing protein [Vibrio sp. SCSIO 43140]
MALLSGSCVELEVIDTLCDYFDITVAELFERIPQNNN